ncbi:MAG TPA: carboxypeptidase-like regulatory domain-containing protein, partial [Thermoanaerobaculia bacterium]
MGLFRRLCVVAGLGFATFASAAPALAEGPGTGVLAGRVRDEKGGALPGVTVEVEGLSPPSLKVLATDRSGAYRMDLPVGTYRVSFK